MMNWVIALIIMQVQMQRSECTGEFVLRFQIVVQGIGIIERYH